MFVSKVTDKMKEKGITVREMVKQTDLSLQTVTNARDKRIAACSLKTIAKIAKALGCKTKDLFDEKTPPKWMKGK